MKAAVAFAEWYSLALAASVELPDGWFGRPNDNMHRLTWSADRDGKLFVELDGRHHLILADPDVIRNEAGQFEFRCSQIVFDWRDYGSAGTRHVRVFGDGGRVCFHAFLGVL